MMKYQNPAVTLSPKNKPQALSQACFEACRAMFRCLFIQVIAVLFVVTVSMQAATTTVTNKAELEAAIAAAQPGDSILFADGEYRDMGAIKLTSAGTEAQPITLGAVNPGQAFLKGNSRVHFNARHWVVQDLSFVDLTLTTGDGVCLFNASNNRVTRCVFLESNQRPLGDGASTSAARDFFRMIWNAPSENGGEEFVRNIRIDHSIIVAAGHNNPQNWQHSGTLFWMGAGNYGYSKGSGTINQLGQFNAAKFGDKAYWDNLATPAYMRVDHCYIANPRGTLLMYARHQLVFEPTLLAEAKGVDPSVIPEEYRGKYFDVASGVQFDSNLIDMEGHNNFGFLKSQAHVFFNNTFHAMQEGALLWSKNQSFIKNYVLNTGYPGLPIRGEVWVAGNYFEYNKGDQYQNGAALGLSAGRKREGAENLEWVTGINYNSLYADNVFKLTSNDSGQGIRAIGAGQPAASGYVLDGKLGEQLVEAYGGDPVADTPYTVDGTGYVPYNDTTAHDCEILNNVFHTADSEPHVLSGDDWSDPNSHWQNILTENIFASNYATSSMLNAGNTANGFTALPAGWDENDPYNGLTRTPISSRWQAHPLLPFDMQKMLNDGQLVDIITTDPDYYTTVAVLGLDQTDQRDLGDTFALDRPLDFADVGPSWFSTTELSDIGLAIRNSSTPSKQMLPEWPTAKITGPIDSNDNWKGKVRIASTAPTALTADYTVPDPNGTVNILWHQVSGPGIASFVDSSVANTTVSFDTPGVYLLAITVDNGNWRSYTDYLEVTYLPAAPVEWLTPQDITGVEVISQNGALEVALNGGTSSPTIAGDVYQSYQVGTNSNNQLQGQSTNDSGLTTLLDQNTDAGGQIDLGELIPGGLVVGNIYEIQWLAASKVYGPQERTLTITSGPMDDEDKIVLYLNPGSSVYGQYGLGTFVADSPYQVISYSGWGVSGLQIRDVTNTIPVINDQIFNVSDTLATGGTVATVAVSTQVQNDTLNFSFQSGNLNGIFSIDNQGVITTTAPLNSFFQEQYVLEVVVTGTQGVSIGLVTVNVSYDDDGDGVSNELELAEGTDPNNAASVPSASYQNLIAWYKLDETNGTQATDSSGHGWTGNLTNAAAWTTNGVVNGAVEFTGVDDVISVGDMGQDLKTLAFWAYFGEAVDASSAAKNLGDFGGGAIRTGASTSRAQNETLTLSGGGDSRTYIRSNIAVGWHHLVFVWDDTAGHYQIWVDNVQQTTYAGTRGHSPLINLSNVSLKNSLLGGRIDEVRFYETSLDAIVLGEVYGHGQANFAPIASDAAVSIADDTEVGTLVTTVSATDANPGDTLSYAISAGNTGGAFAINSTTGEITVAAALDAQANPSYSLTVMVTDSGGLSDTATVDITITEPTALPNSVAHWTLDETSGSSAADSSGNGHTATVNGGVTLGQTGQLGGAFDLNGSNGYLQATGYKGITGGASRTVSAWIKTTADNADIISWGTNSNGQKWVMRVQDTNGTSGALRVEVSGGYIVGSTVVNDGQWHHVAAVLESDGSPNVNEVRLYVDGVLEVASTTQATAINTASGDDVKIGNSQSNNRYFDGSLDDVRIYDVALDAAQVAVLPTGGGIPNNAPEANDGSGSVAENLAAGEAVATVDASDPDTGDTLTYAITGGNTGNAFAIDASGNITTATVLDYETLDSYLLTIEVTDEGGLSDTAVIDVTVTNVNEAPTAADASGSVVENASMGTAVATVSASDPDVGDTLSYEITGGNPGNAFAIDQNGNITVASVIDFEAISSYTLTVEVADQAVLYDYATVTITVTNVNEAPSVADGSGSVAENMAAGTAVVTVSASDPDTGDTLSYTITAGNTGNVFAIDGNGNITTTTALNYETLNSYNLTVAVTDSGSLSDTATVSVTVTNVNEDPVANDGSGSVAEDVVVGTIVATVLASDPDVGDTLSYTITAGNTGNAFAIDASGNITTAAELDYETLASYNLTVEVTDSGGLTDTATVTVSVTDVNEGPVAHWTLDETSGTTAADSSGNGRDASVIGGVTIGQFGRIGGSFDFDGTSGYLTATGYKGVTGGASRTVSAWIKTSSTSAEILSWGTNTTGNRWNFRLQPSSGVLRVEVNGGYAEGSTVVSDGQWHHVAAVLEDGSSNVNQVKFYVDGVLDTQSASLSRTVNTASNGVDVHIGKEAFSSRYFPGSMDDVRIYDVALSAAEVSALASPPNQAPVVSDGSGSVAEDAAIGTAVTTVTANDSDPGDMLSYAITAGNVGGAFAIDSSGNITTATALDYETLNSYNLTVTVTDTGGLSDTAAVSVSVTDVLEITAPSIATGAASNLSIDSADLAYSISDDGGEAPAVTLYYGESDGGTTAGSWSNSAVLGTQGVGSHSTSLSGLTDGTTYYYSFRASNSAGESWGSSGSFTTVVDTSPKLVRTTVNNVSSTSWTSVDLGRNYTSAVIVATPIYPGSTTPPVVTRIRNVSGSSFEVKLDRADGQTGAVSVDVSIVAVEEGVYTQAADGVTMEAVKFTSTITADGPNNWNGETRSYQNSYTNPVVVGQVMSANDADWSVFFSMGNTRTSPATASVLNVGKHVGEDPDNTRSDETIGYIVIESGSGTINGVAYEAGVGADIVRGYDNSTTPYSYSLSGNLSSASAAAVNLAGMDGSDGGWAVLSGANPLSPTSLQLHVKEDDLGDSEQAHTTEQISYLVFE